MQWVDRVGGIRRLISRCAGISEKVARAGRTKKSKDATLAYPTGTPT